MDVQVILDDEPIKLRQWHTSYGVCKLPEYTTSSFLGVSRVSSRIEQGEVVRSRDGLGDIQLEWARSFSHIERFFEWQRYIQRSPSPSP